MSGAEALAGLSLLCNVMQIVTFARDVIVTYKSIEDSHTLDPRLKQICEAAREPYESIVREADHMGPLKKEQRDLVEAAQKCMGRIEELNRMMSRLAIPEDRRRLRKAMKAIGRSVSSMWQKKEVEALEKDLERYQGLVDTQLLRHISSQAQTSERQNLQSFAEVDDRLRKVLETYRTENLTIQQFILTQNERMKACVTETGAGITRQLAATELGIRYDISALENNRLDERTRAEQEQQQRRLLDSLHFPERNARWNRIEENYPKTFEWVLSRPENSQDESQSSTTMTLAPWLRSNSKMFWISGKPGSGKSTLMKYIITNPTTLEHLQHWNPEVHLIHHCFWKSGVPMQNSVDGMLCSLLYQILERQPSLVQSIHGNGFDPAGKRSHHDWSTKELRDNLFRLLKMTDSYFCIFLDGLDEVVEHLHKFDIKSLLDGLVQLDHVRICASSRPEPKFEMYFTGTKQLAIHDLTSKDISRLVQKRLEDMRIDQGFGRELARIVERRAQGVFMWVILVLNSVQMGIESETPQECLERVSRMSQDLHLLYRDMWARATHHGIDPTTATVYFDLIIRRHSVRVRRRTAFSEVNLLELALMSSNEAILSTFFERSDGLTAEELHEHVEKTENRIKLGCAGLLECLPKSAGNFRVKSGPKEMCDWARTVVEFTHRTAFDFFTDSEYGRDILAKSPLRSTDVFLRSLKSIMLECRCLDLKAPFYVWRRHLRVRSATLEIVKWISYYEDNDSEICEVAEGMTQILWEWHQNGYWHDQAWREAHEKQLSLPEEPAKILLLEFMEALAIFYPRMACKFIQGLQASDFFDALPVILYMSSCGPYTIPGLANQMLSLIRHSLSRLDELDDSGEFARQGDLSRAIALALSALLRQITRAVYWPVDTYGLYHGFSFSEQQSLLLRDAVDTIKSFAKLEISDHFSEHSFLEVLSFDFSRNLLIWDSGNPYQHSIMIDVNDSFLKHCLATRSHEDLQDLLQDASNKPILEVCLVGKQTETLAVVWRKPSLSDARKMRDLLFQAFTEKQGFHLVWDQIVELFLSMDGANKGALTLSRGESHEREDDVSGDLEDLGHVQHPWLFSPF